MAAAMQTIANDAAASAPQKRDFSSGGNGQHCRNAREGGGAMAETMGAKCERTGNALKSHNRKLL